MKALNAALLALLLAVTPALAKSDKVPAGAGFSADDVRIITEAVGTILGAGDTASEQDKGGKADKANKKAKKGLPPGLQKRLDRGDTLPPGLADRPLPPGLNARLGASLPGTERRIAGTDVVLIEKATGIVLDVIRDVLKD